MEPRSIADRSPGQADYFADHYPDCELRNPPRKLLFYRQLAEFSLQKPEPKVLELGCAFGQLLATLDPTWKRFGLDTSARAIRVAQRRSPAAALAVASAAQLPLRAAFDLIMAFDVLEHLQDLDEVRRRLRENLAAQGSLVFVVPVYDGPLGWMVRLLDDDPTHVHKRGRGFWLEWAREEFEIIKWCGIFRYLCPGGIYVHVPTMALRMVAPAIAIVGRRKPPK